MRGDRIAKEINDIMLCHLAIDLDSAASSPSSLPLPSQLALQISHYSNSQLVQESSNPPRNRLTRLWEEVEQYRKKNHEDEILKKEKAKLQV